MAKSKGLRTAIIFYDAIPYKLKEMYAPEAIRLYMEFMSSLVDFDYVFPISSTSRFDLRKFLFQRSERLVNIETRLRDISLPGELMERARTEVYKEPESTVIRILCVSTIEQRKNHIRLLESFDRLCNEGMQDIELILVGNGFVPELAKMVEAYATRNKQIQWLKGVDDAALAREYSKSHFTVYPSIEEGFGLPIVESLWYGKPCLCRNTGSMSELAQGGGCLTVDTTNVDELAKAIKLLAIDKELRSKLGNEAVNRRLKTWSEYAFEILQYLAGKAEVN
jgi:glycosyltransferase involved in cell wall biosynthesis